MTTHAARFCQNPWRGRSEGPPLPAALCRVLSGARADPPTSWKRVGARVSPSCRFGARVCWGAHGALERKSPGDIRAEEGAAAEPHVHVAHGDGGVGSPPTRVPPSLCSARRPALLGGGSRGRPWPLCRLFLSSWGPLRPSEGAGVPGGEPAPGAGGGGGAWPAAPSALTRSAPGWQRDPGQRTLSASDVCVHV